MSRLSAFQCLVLNGLFNVASLSGSHKPSFPNLSATLNGLRGAFDVAPSPSPFHALCFLFYFFAALSDVYLFFPPAISEHQDLSCHLLIKAFISPAPPPPPTLTSTHPLTFPVAARAKRTRCSMKSSP